jgi:two-component system OmpR family sensor kinase
VSLRARLLIGLVALVVVGLGVTAVVTYEEQRSFLLTRVDQQVGDSRIPVAVALRVIHPGGRSSVPRPSATAGARAPSTFQTSGTYGLLLDANHRVLQTQSFTYGERPASAPRLPHRFPVSQFRSTQVRVFTVDSQAGPGLTYRVAAFALRGGRILVIAVPLRDVHQTLHRLLVVEALVGAGVVLGLIALGWVVIGVGLRPLERIGRIASEIAHGNLSRRVTPADDRTEVGRLGTSLNEMLGQIEHAFAERGRSEERLRRFLADASHELRTPLASIRGYAELFRLGVARDPEETERAMGRIEAEATRMGALVENLLLLARLEEVPEAPLAEVDLAELAQQVAQDTRAAASDRPVTVTAHEPVNLLGDPEQLRQVLSNLTRNAVIHTPPGTGIDIRVIQEADQAVLEVRDHGPGLPPEAGEQLFERFWRTQGGRSRGPGGAGLGLAIVKAIVDNHHGTVHARNAPGGGAIFRVTLPLAPSTELSPAGLDRTGPPSQLPSAG